MNTELLNKIKDLVDDEANYAVKDCNGNYQEIFYYEDKWQWVIADCLTNQRDNGYNHKDDSIDTSTLIVLDWDDDDDEHSIYPYEAYEDAQDLILRYGELGDREYDDISCEFPKY